MTVMGDAQPQKWSDELQREGRVIFPIRAAAVWRELGLIWLIVAITQTLSFSQSWGEGDTRQYLALAVVLSAVVVTFWHTSRLYARYPALTVDEFGLKIGLKKSIGWSDLGAIGLLRGGRLPIIPKDAWGKELIIPATAAKDMQALQQWLEELLKNHRTAEQSAAESSD
ncbi:hypothetical protein [Kribbella ginsengisoli]|uniref:PH domain-containing protein n=1 Tax=Kribbella ginsengisoli TaxID=363865 RepID=A0ABP6WH50_9ACTN